MTISTRVIVANEQEPSAPLSARKSGVTILAQKNISVRSPITSRPSGTGGTSRNESSYESRFSAEDRRGASTATCSRDAAAATTSTDTNDTSSSLRANAFADLRDSISTKDVLSAMLGQEPSGVTKLREEERKKKNIHPPLPPPLAPTPLTPSTFVEVLTEDISRGAKEVRQDIVENIIQSDGVAATRVSESEADNNLSFTDIINADYVPEEVSNAMINMGIIKAPEVKPKTYWERAEEMFAVDGLTYKQRLIGCGSCMVVGYLLSFGSVFRANALLKGNPIPFVLTATLGNIVALCGSCFLSGPRAQTKTMFHKRRRLASCGYLASLFLTIVFAFKTGMTRQKQIMIALMAFQYMSIAVYCLSYVPFLDEIIQVLYLKLRKIVKGKNGEEDDDEEEEELPDFRVMV